MLLITKAQAMTHTPDGALHLAADPLALREIGPWLGELVARFDLASTRFEVAAAELAVHEIAMNIVDHAFAHGPGSIVLTGSYHDGAVTIATSDTGAPFVAEDYVPPVDGQPQIGGYGLHIADQLAESVEYERRDGENRWRVVFRC